jgi:hypothetical protein
MKQKDILAIAILLFIFTFVWIGGSIYHSASNSTISEKVNNDITPIPPNFNVKVIEKIKERKKINPSLELEGITPTPTPLPLKLISPKKASEEAKLQI